MRVHPYYAIIMLATFVSHSKYIIPKNKLKFQKQGSRKTLCFIVLGKAYESSTVSLIDVDIFIPTVETPLREIQLECVAGTSYLSARPSVTHMVIPGSQEAQTPPRVRPPSRLQPPTPSGSGNYPRRRQLDLTGVQGHTGETRPILKC